ncbi:YgiQ family radical SAM protein, partial [bacterium]|nr:YgiQ family radical SAM protein [bacterium]
GVAVIARLLEDMGLRVGIIAQPNPRRVVDFTQLGEPRLFFGVTSGCSDSMLNNYSPTRRPRKIDNYSPGRLPGKRPDHAPIVYTRSLKEVFPNVPVILGGIEASLRRLAHFDFFDDEVKMSILAESGADLLVYGQGERTMREIVDELREGKGLSGCRKIRGVVWRASLDEKLEATVGEHTMVPSFEETVQSKDAFYDMAKTNLHNMDPHFAKVLVQEHPNAYVVINKPQIPLSTAELDEVYELEYTRTPHPKYKKQGAIPAFETVKFSIMTHRGCNAGCNFCPIYFHQGRYITSRSEENIVDEVEHVSKFHYFRNVISNVGGPVGNVYKSQCAKLDEGAEADGACERPSCTYPDPCKNLTIDQKPYLDLLKQVLAVENVRQAFIASGVRYDLLEHDEHGQELLELLIERLSGRQFKTAVVHVSDSVNRRAGKYTTETTERFMDNCVSTVKKLGMDGDFEIIPYFTASHPGSTMEDALDVAMFLKEHGLERIQIHDFVPTPGTASECM